MPPLRRFPYGLFAVLHSLQGLAHGPAGGIGPVILPGDVFGLIGSTLCGAKRNFAGSRVGRSLLGNVTGDLAQQQ